MKTVLSVEQLEDLASLHAVVDRFGVDFAIIGATALLCFVDLGRFTRDIDLVVALDLEAFSVFAEDLRANGWTREAHQEHRWRGPSGTTIDLIPAGPDLRKAKRIVWPESDFEMSLVGFEHVFREASLVRFAPDAQYKVAPPGVIALLKMISYMGDRHRRQKDLVDLRTLFRRYETNSDRIFHEDVFEAGLADIEYANAFLLGLDVRAIVTSEEAAFVTAFLREEQIHGEELQELGSEALQHKEAVRFQYQLRAFMQAFDREPDSMPS